MRPRQTLTQRPDSGLSTASLSAAEGDDLLRARLFCQQASTEMTAIIAADRAPNPLGGGTLRQGRDPVWLCEKLTIIQRGAKRARARAIYRSAQDVLGLIQRRNAHMPIDWTRVDGRLFVLNKLLGQYENGLNEIEPQQTHAEEHSDLGDTAPSINFDPVEAVARETLESLLPHASEEEQAALKRLMDYNPALNETAEPEPEALPEAPASAPVDSIEHILPDLVQNLLEVGREYGKILSVSHTLDDVKLREGTAKAFADSLFNRLSDLIASNLPLQGVGRLDLAPSEKGLRISGSGFETFEFSFADLDVTAEDVSDQAAPDIEDKLTTEDAVEKAKAPKPRINDDTEADLREQLAALMDGGGFEP